PLQGWLPNSNADSNDRSCTSRCLPSRRSIPFSGAESVADIHEYARRPEAGADNNADLRSGSAGDRYYDWSAASALRRPYAQPAVTHAALAPSGENRG